jgi:phosphatidylserine decarboxylase
MYLSELPMICVQVAFVAIGATMVGSINFTKKKGDYVKKGDEVWYPASYSKSLFFQIFSLFLFLISICLL